MPAVETGLAGASHPVLVFIHIPKTAGTTLRSVIRMDEPGERNARPGANVFRGGGGHNTKTLDKLRDDARALDLDVVRVLHGHQPFGIRDYLERDFPEREFRYLTVLRDPVERSLSHYFEALSHAGEAPPAEDLKPLAPDATFDSASEAGYLYDNLQTRMLSGVVAPFGEVNDDMLEQAKHNLRKEFALVGLTERLDESLVLAKQRLGLRSLLVEPERVRTSRPRGSQVARELRDAATRANRYDMELYRVAEDLFERAPEREQLDFHVELAALQTAKASCDPDPSRPAPSQFHGGDREWRMLIAARVMLLRLEDERSQRKARLAAGKPESPPAGPERMRSRRRSIPFVRARRAEPESGLRTTADALTDHD